MPTAKATPAEERFSACLELIRLVTLLAMVISSPSSTQATPRATTSRVWNRDQPRRSSRAGIRLRMVPSGASDVRRSGPAPAAVPPLGSVVTSVIAHPPCRRSGSTYSPMRFGPIHRRTTVGVDVRRETPGDIRGDVPTGGAAAVNGPCGRESLRSAGGWGGHGTVVAAPGPVPPGGHRHRQAASAHRAEPGRVEVAGAADALGVGPTASGAVRPSGPGGRRAGKVRHRSPAGQRTPVSAPTGMRRSSSIWRSSSAERPRVVR